MNPIRVDQVDLRQVPRLASVKGRLGMTFLPGKHDQGRAGTHRRNLDDDVRTLRSVYAADTLVLLLEDHELYEARVTDLPSVMTVGCIKLVRFPIVDGGVATDRDALRDLLDDLLCRLVAGENLVVACRGGLGRTGTIVGCLLRDGGLGGDEAIALTRKSRDDTIENDRQEDFVRAWDWPAREILA